MDMLGKYKNPMQSPGPGGGGFKIGGGGFRPSGKAGFRAHGPGPFAGHPGQGAFGGGPRPGHRAVFVRPFGWGRRRSCGCGGFFVLLIIVGVILAIYFTKGF